MKRQIAYPEAGWYRLDTVVLEDGKGGLADSSRRMHFCLDGPEIDPQAAIANVIVWLDERYRVCQLQPYPAGFTRKNLNDYGSIVQDFMPYMRKSAWTGPEPYHQYSLSRLFGRLEALIGFAALLDGVADSHEFGVRLADMRDLLSADVPLVGPELAPILAAAIDTRVNELEARARAKELADAEAELSKRAPKGDHVYVIRHGEEDVYKIGIAKDPEKRARDLSTGSPYPLTVIAKRRVARARQAEGMLHKMFRKHRTSGEWFHLPTEKAQELLRLVNGLDGPA